MEQRLQRVEDELAIRRVLVDYSATQDAHDYAGYAALFARDGEWVNGKTVHKGREAILKMLVDLYGTPPPGYVNSESYHITSNAQIDLQGDRATVRSRHLLVMRGPRRGADAGPGRPLRGRVHPRGRQVEDPAARRLSDHAHVRGVDEVHPRAQRHEVAAGAATRRSCAKAAALVRQCGNRRCVAVCGLVYRGHHWMVHLGDRRIGQFRIALIDIGARRDITVVER